MTRNDGALGQLSAQVGAGTDCLVEGSPAAAQALFARAAVALAVSAEVIVVASPLGELGLSSLIAQVSGRPDYNDQDDAVLELGFKRLTAAGRTVLMLEARQGIGLPALRYLQHVGRSTPGLVLVVLGSPALDEALGQPGAAAMRARLRAMPVIKAENEGAPVQVEAAPLIAEPGPIPLSSPVGRRFRLLPWAAAAVSVAAASVIVVQLSRVPDGDAPVPAMPATVTQTSTVIAPAPAVVELPVAAPEPVVPPAISFPAPIPAPAAAPPLPPLVKPDRVLHARRVEPKPRAVTRAGRSSPEWRGDDSTRDSWDSEPPPWRRRALRWGEPSYGGYAVDPYGTPLYPFSR